MKTSVGNPLKISAIPLIFQVAWVVVAKPDSYPNRLRQAARNALYPRVVAPVTLFAMSLSTRGGATEK
jgi:hypothetical protein